MAFCKEEMKVQGWGIHDLVNAVDYIKVKGGTCRTLHGILWYVDEAREWQDKLVSIREDYDLHTKVAEALAVEQDEGWARKLSLASGRALEVVYANWERAHG